MDGQFGARGFENAAPIASAEFKPARAQSQPIGAVLEMDGSTSQVVFDQAALDVLPASSDAAIANAGTVGSQVKVRVGNTWLIANVRALKLETADRIAAQIDFLGEGDEERLTGKLYNFRRGVTRYPTPGADAFPVSTAHLQQIYGADKRANVEIGPVYPTKDIRASLFVDSMLGKHFALLGSTGTGKSTSAALILHRICDMAPKGHILMIDPHGEYSAAFKTNGAIFDVNNLAMPYWLMNFEEHCEVFVTSTGNDNQLDRDILAKCLLAARARSRTAEGISKLTVDSPIPYLLSDLTTIIQAEMGKLEKA